MNAEIGAARLHFEGRGGRGAQVQLLNANDSATISGIGDATQLTYIRGTRQSDMIRTPESLLCHGVYPGIDLAYSTSGGALKSEFRVAAGANPSLIRIRYGATHDRPTIRNGDLIVSTDGGVLREQRPEIYQMIGEERIPVRGGYAIADDGTVGFTLDRYDASKPLIIDPQIEFSTLWGGGLQDAVTGVAIGPDGSVYATGWTESTDLQTLGPFQSSSKGGVEGFVVKLAPSGKTVVYATYLGGNGYDMPHGIAVDSTGAAYITGQTTSSNFPAVAAYQGRLKGFHDAFVLKLAANGRSVVYSTYLGGGDTDIANAIQVDTSGAAYITGETRSTDFPVRNALQARSGGGSDAFVAKLASTGSLVFSTYLGGSGVDRALAIAVRSGEAYITGSTDSANFPLQSALQPMVRGGSDAFVTRINANGSALLYSTYLGGSSGFQSSPEAGYGIAVNGNGEAYIVGATPSTDFPITGGIQRLPGGGGADGFIVKLNAAGTSMLYSTYIGGQGVDVANAVALDSWGDAFVVGSTWSSDFPLVNTLQPLKRGQADAFVMCLDSSGSSLLFSTFWGGTDIEGGLSVALSRRYLVIGGQTQSFDVPLKGALQDWNGSAGGFLARFAVGDLLMTARQRSFGVFVNGRWYLDTNGNYTADTSDRSVTFGAAGDTPVWGDWDGSGRIKVGTYRNGYWYLDYNGSGKWDDGDRLLNFGIPGDIPVVGDWDGSGTTKIGVFRNGSWFLDYNGTGEWEAGDRRYGLGSAGDTPVVGDWDGTGTSKIGIYRKGYWYLDFNGSGVFDSGDRTYNFGIPGDLPVVGTWNGSGGSKIGIYRNGRWYLDYNGSGSWDAGDREYAFSVPVGIPLVADWSAIP